MSKILITGASGLIGSRLTILLKEAGHEVVHLGRTKRTGSVPSYVWNIDKGFIDEEAFENVDTVVHLAGAGVGDKRWTAKRKFEILESRTKSTALLANYLENHSQVKTVISASAIGYYGFGLADHEFTEVSNPGTDYLAKVVRAWEAEVDKIKNQRVVKFRIGILLSEKGGALKEMVRVINWYIGSVLASGNQLVSWIHIDDLCSMIVKSIENSSMQGVYNATGLYPVTNRELTKAIAKKLAKPLWLPPAPSFALKLILGEMYKYVVNGSSVSSLKIQKAGFTFKYSTLESALDNLLK